MSFISCRVTSKLIAYFHKWIFTCIFREDWLSISKGTLQRLNVLEVQFPNKLFSKHFTYMNDQLFLLQSCYCYQPLHILTFLKCMKTLYFFVFGQHEIDTFDMTLKNYSNLPNANISWKPPLSQNNWQTTGLWQPTSTLFPTATHILF